MTRKRVLQSTSLMAPPLVIALSSSMKPVTGATSNLVVAAVATVTRIGGVAQAAVAVAVEIATGTGTTKYYTPGEQRTKFAARPTRYIFTLVISFPRNILETLH